MGLQSIFNMRIIDSSVVLGEGGEIVAKHDDKLVPFLVDQWFDEDKIFADLLAESVS